MSEPVTRYLVGPRDEGKRLDQFLHERIPGLSRTRIQAAIRERVTLSWGVRARPATPVRPQGEVRIGYTPLHEEPLDLQIEVIARHPGWLAVDKPPVIPVHPVNKIRENSLIRMLRRQEGREGLRLVHRLDRETSGVLLVAEDSATAAILSRGFAAGQVDKQYLALVEGLIEADAGEIVAPIGKHPTSRVFVKQACVEGQAATTRYQVERRLGDRTLVRLFPTTGRRHQLRVHLAQLGHPILGDILYGRPDAAYLAMVEGTGDPRHDGDGPRRQLLHCARLAFADPAGEGQVVVEAALPRDFAEHLRS